MRGTDEKGWEEMGGKGRKGESEGEGTDVKRRKGKEKKREGKTSERKGSERNER